MEPITLVNVAGINSFTDATVDGTPAHEDFTTMASASVPTRKLISV
ncbi:MAG: hypothetical protein ACTHY4_03605 [Flavobacteriaceae bacterium]|nr:hypothetical protein [Psychroflexus sp.]